MGSGVFDWSLLTARWLGSKLIYVISLKRILKYRHDRARHGSAGYNRVERRVAQGSAGRAMQGSEMKGVLLVPYHRHLHYRPSMMALT